MTQKQLTLNGSDIVPYTLADSIVDEDYNSAFEDLFSYGVEWVLSSYSPTCTRIGNKLFHKTLPILSQYKGCVYDTKTDAFKYWLNENDWNYKADGTASVLDGTDGSVMVHIPRFYGKSGSGTNASGESTYWVRISPIKIDDSWVEIPEMYVGAYKMAVNHDTLEGASVVNTTTTYRGGSGSSSNTLNTSTTYDSYLHSDPCRTALGKPILKHNLATARTYARNANAELLCYDYYKWIFYWAYVIEYASFNCQLAYNSTLTSDGYHLGGLGDGVTTLTFSLWNSYNSLTSPTPCGYGNSIGNGTGTVSMTVNTSTAVTVAVPRWHGFDNPFGDILTNLEGIVISYNLVYSTSDPAYFDETITGKTLRGTEDKHSSGDYTLEFAPGETGEIYPAVYGASATTGKCDSHWFATGTSTIYTVYIGGSASHGARAGLGAFNSFDAVGGASATGGFRLVKVCE